MFRRTPCRSSTTTGKTSNTRAGGDTIGGRVDVVVADSHPLIREGVACSIAEHPSMQVVGQAGDGQSAIAQLRELRPDVALVEMRLPNGDGLAVLAACHAAAPATRVLFLGEHFERRVMMRALHAGAAGFIPAKATPGELQTALAAAAQGSPVLNLDAQHEILEHLRDNHQSTASALSKREHQILALVASGKSAAQIAQALYLEQTTIRTHLRRLYSKLGVTNSASAVAEAMRRGLLE